MSEGELELYQDWGRRVDGSFMNYLKFVLYKMDPLNNLISS